MRYRILFKLILPISLVSSLLLTVGVVGAWYIHRQQKQTSATLARHVAGVRAAEELEIVLREVRNRLNQFLLTGDRKFLEEIPKLNERLEHWLTRSTETAATPFEQGLVETINNGYREFRKRFDPLQTLEAAQISKETVGDLSRNVVTQEMLRYSHQYLDFNEREVTEGSERNEAFANRLMLGLLLLGTCGAVAGLVAGYGIARGISRSILQLNVPISDVAGKLNEVVGPIAISADPAFEDLNLVLHQISERVAVVVDRLHQSHRDVLRSEQLAAIGQLAAGLAHELRNPLMSMKLLVQSGMEGSPGRLEGRDLAVLEEEIGRLEQLLHSFLDFARPPKLEPTPVALVDVVRPMADFVRPRAESQQVAIHLELPDESPIVNGDPTQLRQLLLNLLLNALDATGTTGTIDIELATEDRPAQAEGRATRVVGRPWAILRVADAGRGLPAELGERIFDPFVSTKETGVGLGLSICRRIVEAHGGSIQAENRNGRGAVFTVRLPIADGVPIIHSRSTTAESQTLVAAQLPKN